MEEADISKAALAKLVDDCHPPIHLTVLLRSYRIARGKEFSFEAFGCTNPAQFFEIYFPELTLVRCDKTSEGFMIYSKTQTRELDRLTPDAEPSNNLLPPATPFCSPTTALKSTSSSKTWVKKSVPVQFKVFLARILDQYPLGISARDFVDVFFKTSGSPLSYKLYGYPGHHSMFRDLPDVFHIEVQTDGQLRLFPIESVKDALKSSFEPHTASVNCSNNNHSLNHSLNHSHNHSHSPSHSHSNSNSNSNNNNISHDHDHNNNNISHDNNINQCEKYFVSELAEEGDENQPPAQTVGLKLSSTETNIVSNPAVKKWKTTNGYLITVVLDEHILVPTACMATLLKLDSDDILLQLKQQGIDVRGMKFLSPDISNHYDILEQLAFMGCSSVLCEDGSLGQVITLVPIESCSFILSAFSGQSSTMQQQLKQIKEIMSSFKSLRLGSQM